MAGILNQINQTASEKRTSDFRFIIFLTLMLVWAAPQSLVVLQTLPAAFVQFLFHLKNPMGVIVFVVGTLLYLNEIRIEPIFTTIWFFCTYTFLAKLVQGIDVGIRFYSISSPLMYFVWMWIFFVLLPSILDTQDKLKLFLRWMIYPAVFVVVLIIILNILSGIDLYRIVGGNRHGALRYDFGFRNPSYIGGILLAIIFGGLFLRNISTYKLERIFLVIIMGIAFWMIYLADSRSSIMMSLVVWFVYWALLTTQRKWLVRLIGMILIVVLLYTILTITTRDNSLESINYTSSGRVYNWLSLIKKMTNSVQNILFGSALNSMGWTTAFRTISGETVYSLFRRYRIDNTYLDLSFQYGIPAMLLFVAVFHQLLRMAFSARRANSFKKPEYLNLNLAIGIIYGFSVYLLTTSNLPSLGNLTNIVLVPPTVASIMIARRTL